MQLQEELQSIKTLSKEDKLQALHKSLEVSKSLLNENNLALKGELYELIGSFYYDLENFSSAIEWYLQALDIKRETNDLRGEAVVRNNIGITYVEISQYAEALKYFEKAIALKIDLKDEQSLTATYENIGVVYQKQSNYKKAIEAFYESLKISEKLNDKDRMAITYQNIGSLHYAQGDEVSALKMFEQALDFKKDSHDFQRKVQLLNNIAVMLKQMNRTSEAVDYYNQCIEISEKNNYSAGLRGASNNLGELYLLEGELDKAITAFTRCFKVAVAAKNTADIKIAELNLGKAELLRGNLEAAENYFLGSLEKYTEAGHQQGLHDLHLCLSQLYEKKNDLHKALDFFKTYDELKAKQLNTENSTIIHELKTKYEVEKKEKENEISRLRNIELKDALEDLTIEKRRSEKLLLNILPEEIAYELKRNGKVKAQQYDSVTVMFADIKSFTKHSENLTPDVIVDLLDLYFEMFDGIMQNHDVEKIKTIGDAYLCVCGLPNLNSNHAEQMVAAALEMRNNVALENEKRKAKGLPCFEFRFGIHSGPVIAGIVGKTKFEYDIWGDTVNTAARMEQNGETGKINMSESTYRLVQNKFLCSYRGKLEAKNKGEMDMYFAEANS